MEKILQILEDLLPTADFETCTTLIDDNILDSFSLLSLVNELEEEFKVRITPAEMTPSNFNSAQAILDMVTRLQG